MRNYSQIINGPWLFTVIFTVCELGTTDHILYHLYWYSQLSIYQLIIKLLRFVCWLNKYLMINYQYHKHLYFSFIVVLWLFLSILNGQCRSIVITQMCVLQLLHYVIHHSFMKSSPDTSSVLYIMKIYFLCATICQVKSKTDLLAWQFA